MSVHCSEIYFYVVVWTSLGFFVFFLCTTIQCLHGEELPLFWWCNHMCDGKAFILCLYLIPSTFSKNGCIRFSKLKISFFFAAPGGTLADDVTCTEFCLFKAQEDMETMQAYAQVITIKLLLWTLTHSTIERGLCENCSLSFQVFNKLIRRYKYLEKGFEEEIKKVCNGELYWNKRHIFKSRWWVPEHCIAVQFIYENGQFRLCPEDSIHEFALPQLLLFLKGFTESERNKLAMLTGILLANGNLSASILSSLFNENLVKEGTRCSDS